MEIFSALMSMLLSVACAVGVFVAAKKRIGMPVWLNLPGALLAFLMAIGFTGWVNTAFGIFDNQIGPPAPEMPWYTWMIYAVITLGWYFLMWLLVRLWRQAHAKLQEGDACRT